MQPPSSDRSSQLKQIVDAIQTHRNTDAAQLLQTFLRQYPQDADGWYMVSLVVTNPARQIEALNKALALDPSHKQAQNRLLKLQGISDRAVNQAPPTYSPPPPPPPMYYQAPPPPLELPRRFQQFPTNYQATKPKRSRGLLLVLLGGGIALLIIGAIFVFVVLPALNNQRGNNGSQTGSVGNAATLPPEARTTLDQFLREQQSPKQYQIVSAVQASNPKPFTPLSLLSESVTPDSAWCVVITPGATLRTYMPGSYDHFVISQTNLLWSVIRARRTVDDYQARDEWLSAGCSNWDDSTTVAANDTNPTMEAVRSVVVGHYMRGSDEIDLTGDGTVRWSSFGYTDVGRYTIQEGLINITGFRNDRDGRYQLQILDGQVQLWNADRGGYAFVSQRPGLVNYGALTSTAAANNQRTQIVATGAVQTATSVPLTDTAAAINRAGTETQAPFASATAIAVLPTINVIRTLAATQTPVVRVLEYGFDDEKSLTSFNHTWMFYGSEGDTACLMIDATNTGFADYAVLVQSQDRNAVVDKKHLPERSAIQFTLSHSGPYTLTIYQTYVNFPYKIYTIKVRFTNRACQ